MSDDGSTDQTIEIVRSFAATVAFPVRINQNSSNVGWRRNFIQAASLCSSPLISFCDQDDIWYPHKLATVANLFENPDTVLAYHDAHLIDEQGTIFGTLRDGLDDVPKLDPLSRPTTWGTSWGLTQTFRRELLSFSPYWSRSIDRKNVSEHAAHDQWIHYLATNIGVTRYSPDCLVGYRQHSSNAAGFTKASAAKSRAWLSMTHPDKAISQMLQAFTEIIESAISDGDSPFIAQLRLAASPNRRLLSYLKRRESIYQEKHLIERLKLYIDIHRAGGYSRVDNWSLGGKAAICDLIVSLLGNHNEPSIIKT